MEPVPLDSTQLGISTEKLSSLCEFPQYQPQIAGDDQVRNLTLCRYFTGAYASI
jgi:hypothetical protein